MSQIHLELVIAKKKNLHLLLLKKHSVGILSVVNLVLRRFCDKQNYVLCSSLDQGLKKSSQILKFSQHPFKIGCWALYF